MPFQYQARSPFQWGLRAFQSEDGPPSSLSTWLAAKFHGVRFQLFISLCPGGDTITMPQLRSRVKRFVRAIEKQHRAPVGAVIGYESAPSPNSHLCIACYVQLDTRWLRDYLKEMLGRLYTDKAVDIRPFDFHRAAVPYALKAADAENRNSDIDDYDLHNLDLFMLDVEVPIFEKRRARARSRQVERLSVEEQRQVDSLRATKPQLPAIQRTLVKDFKAAERNELLAVSRAIAVNRVESGAERRELLLPREITTLMPRPLTNVTAVVPSRASQALAQRQEELRARQKQEKLQKPKTRRKQAREQKKIEAQRWETQRKEAALKTTALALEIRGIRFRNKLLLESIEARERQAALLEEERGTRLSRDAGFSEEWLARVRQALAAECDWEPGENGERILISY